MKKMKISILSLFIVFTMLVAFTGCGTDDTSKFVGTWKTTVNGDELMKQGLDDMAEYINVKGFDIILLYTFNDDGTYNATDDKDATREAVAKLRDPYIEGFRKYMEDIIAIAGLDMSVDDMLAEEGTTVENIVDEILDGLVDEGFFDSTGKWKVEQGKLYMTASASDDFDESEYDTYEISDTELTLLETFGEDVDEWTKSLYPMVMTKVK